MLGSHFRLLRLRFFLIRSNLRRKAETDIPENKQNFGSSGSSLLLSYCVEKHTLHWSGQTVSTWTNRSLRFCDFQH